MNDNTKLVNGWYRNNKIHLQHHNQINLANLIPNHPILRPCTVTEITSIIHNINDKSPGLSGIRAPQIKNLPRNYIQLILHITDCILASKYYPINFKTASMVFALKPNKNPHDPLSYRPISLLEIF